MMSPLITMDESYSGRENHMERNTNLLLIDDEAEAVTVMKSLLKKEGYTIFTAGSGEEGLRVLSENDIAVVVSDFSMPGMDGLALFERMAGTYDHIVKILHTGQATMDTTLKAINQHRLFGYLIKPWPAQEIRAILRNAFDYYNLMAENKHYQMLIQDKNKELSMLNEELEIKVRQRTEMLEDALREGVMMLATAAEEKDKETGDHLLRIQKVSYAICRELKLSDSLSETISLFSVIHDVGKIHIPDKILNKPGALDDEEWIIMRAHTLAGEKILGKKKYYAIAREIARWHHENWDGSGYPDGLSGKQIPVSARIVAVADVYDALTSKRPYKEAWDMARTMEEMAKLSGKKFDPDILTAFFNVLEESRGDAGLMGKKHHTENGFSHD